jgi:hypothetical protein
MAATSTSRNFGQHPEHLDICSLTDEIRDDDDPCITRSDFLQKIRKGSVAIAHLTRERVSIPHRALICERMKYSFRLRVKLPRTLDETDVLGISFPSLP